MSEDVFDNSTGDADDVLILSADNAAEMLSCKKKLYIFPRDESQTRKEGFYVKHAPLSRIKDFQRAAKNASDAMALKAICELMADTVVGSNDVPVWTTDALKSMATARTDRFVFIQRCVCTYNGLTDDSETIDRLIEAAEKNS